MKRTELLSRILIITGILLAAAVPLIFRARTPLVHAQMAQNGGWNPDLIRVEAGQPLHLEFTSDDVVHGFAVGQMDMQSVDILPGKVSEITLTFDKPGNYIFYCTRWCGPNHWRMRGTFEVAGTDISPEPAAKPLYVSLGLDIDAPHDSPVIPAQKPSANRGQELVSKISINRSTDYYRSHSPYQVFEELSSSSLSGQERWDIVAYLVRLNTGEASLANGQALYAQNCAACHGEKGGGDGVFADDLESAGESSMSTMTGDEEMSMKSPVNFTNPTSMLGASPALLQGKILRGGMGTGMPMWGSIFTEEQIWDLIAYLFSFQFEY